jgi:hypothetical protein
MNRTIKEATTLTYHYVSHEQLRIHLETFLQDDNYAKRLKTLGGLTVHQYLWSCWQKNP